MTGDEATTAWLAAMWAMRPTHFRVEAEGASIACRGWNLAATDRPGILLVHGFRAHGGWWEHIAPALADDHRVVALDLGGMGDSGHRSAYARATFGREILAVARSVGFARPIVIAHSFGAIASILACAQAPGTVERLIVLDSALPTETDAGFQMPTPPLRTYPDRDTAISRFRLIPPGGWPVPEILRHIAETSVVQMPDGRWSWKFDNAMPLTLNTEIYRARMLGVPVPADVIYGDRTEIFTPERRAMVPVMLPNCGRLIALPACHHHVMVEQPIALVAALRTLLANPKG